jgi:hypothetical protein
MMIIALMLPSMASEINLSQASFRLARHYDVPISVESYASSPRHGIRFEPPEVAGTSLADDLASLIAYHNHLSPCDRYVARLEPFVALRLTRSTGPDGVCRDHSSILDAPFGQSSNLVIGPGLTEWGQQIVFKGHEGIEGLEEVCDVDQETCPSPLELLDGLLTRHPRTYWGALVNDQGVYIQAFDFDRVVERIEAADAARDGGEETATPEETPPPAVGIARNMLAQFQRKRDVPPEAVEFLESTLADATRDPGEPITAEEWTALQAAGSAPPKSSPASP